MAKDYSISSMLERRKAFTPKYGTRTIHPDAMGFRPTSLYGGGNIFQIQGSDVGRTEEDVTNYRVREGEEPYMDDPVYYEGYGADNLYSAVDKMLYNPEDSLTIAQAILRDPENIGTYSRGRPNLDMYIENQLSQNPEDYTRKDRRTLEKMLDYIPSLPSYYGGQEKGRFEWLQEDIDQFTRKFKGSQEFGSANTWDIWDSPLGGAIPLGGRGYEVEPSTDIPLGGSSYQPRKTFPVPLAGGSQLPEDLRDEGDRIEREVLEDFLNGSGASAPLF